MANKTILYAEDDKAAREIVLEFLGWDFPDLNVEPFRDGISLEKRLKGDTNEICAVITDNEMPGINGATIIDKYAPILNEIPFIFFYGGDKSSGESLSKKYDNVIYAPKPDVEELMKTLKLALSSQ